jgi:hypothetical protein
MCACSRVCVSVCAVQHFPCQCSDSYKEIKKGCLFFEFHWHLLVTVGLQLLATFPMLAVSPFFLSRCSLLPVWSPLVAVCALRYRLLLLKGPHRALAVVVLQPLELRKLCYVFRVST